MSSLTVMIIAPSAYTLGGIQTWLDHLMPGLKTLGWHVVLGLVSGRHHDVNAYLAAHPYDKTILIENRTGSSEGRVDAIAKAIRAVRPNIVAAVNIIDVYAAVLRLKKRYGGHPKVVATLHGLQSDFVYDTKIYGGIVDGVICTNRLLQKLVREYSGIAPRRVLYAPYGVNVPCKGRSAENTRELVTIAYVGRLERTQKRFHDVLEILVLALKNGLKVKLIVAGEGSEMNWFVEELKDRNLSNHVEVLGELDQSQLVKNVYDVADALLITSSWETGPIVAWEAMAHRKVVITSRYIGSGKEGALVGGHNCLMFDIGDIASAVECIARLEHKEHREMLVRNALSVVDTRYSLDHSIESWAEQLQTVMSFSPRRIRELRSGWRGATSRLDRVLGMRVGELVRRILRREFVHKEAGGEWPHTFAKSLEDDMDFLAVADNADRC